MKKEDKILLGAFLTAGAAIVPYLSMSYSIFRNMNDTKFMIFSVFALCVIALIVIVAICYIKSRSGNQGKSS